MTQEKEYYYLYRHIRLDKNEVFYIGISNKSTSSPHHKKIYKRAYSKTSRNPIWKNIVSKTKYEVEIVLESDDIEFIKQQEIEFIHLYGRKDLGTGILSNMTDGGDLKRFSIETIEKIRFKALNRIRVYSNETREKLGRVHRGIKRSEAFCKNLSQKKMGNIPGNRRKVRMITPNETVEFASVKDAEDYNGMRSGRLWHYLTNRKRHSKGYIFQYIS